jgi:hypothetical protein
MLIPGRLPISVLVTMILGLIGSAVGGLISTLIFGYNAAHPGFHTGVFDHVHDWGGHRLWTIHQLLREDCRLNRESGDGIMQPSRGDSC